MRHSRLALGAAAAVAVTVTAFTSSSALGSSAPPASSPATATNVRVPRGCNYPPQVRPTVTLIGPASVRRARSFTLTGTLRLNSCGLPDWPVGLYAALQQNGPYVLVAVTDTAKGGNAGAFSFTRSGIVTPTYYKVVSIAGDGLQTATSNVVRVAVTS